MTNKTLNMKKFVRLFATVAFIVVSLSLSAQSNYPFEVKISGKGNSSIIFIPGFACSGEVWKETRSVFEKDFTCYTLTMAGFAGIPAQPAPSFQNWKKSIAAFIQQSEIDKPIIIGHSMGGALAMAIAADYPELISKIIVVDALPCLAALFDPVFKVKENNDCNAMTEQIITASNEQFYRMQKQIIPQLLADTSKQDLVVNWSVKSDRTTFAKMYCDFSNTDLRKEITNIKCPVLILLESYFVNFKPAINDQFRNLKTANLQYATKGLHFIMYDDQEWYIKQLNDFIK
jgi:pimeloyl-ACP methyl ester carboxylesterase